MAVHKKKNIILVVDEEPQIRKLLNIFLESEDFKIIESTCGKQAVRSCLSTKPDLLLLDLTLPDMDGKTLIKTIREWSQVPIIVISAQSADETIVEALNLGANDYIVKPFNMEILLARINVSLRVWAMQETGEPQLHNGPLRMDLVRHEVFFNNTLIPFTPKEYDLLRYFMTNCGKMLLHKDILKDVWGAAHGEDVAYLRVYIGQIREKIEENPTSPQLIKTEPGIGYRMENLTILSKIAQKFRLYDASI